MNIKFTDYNDAASIIGNEWELIEKIISETKLRLKASDQRGLQGTPIFDPVGTNSVLKDKLVEIGWSPNVAIPKSYKFLGTDVDFEKRGIITEVQFSNYPFLLNNLVRTYLFSRQNVKFNNVPPKALIIITKCKVFPASNSTLYYEQGQKQLNVLASPEVFNLPVRLVGLSEDVGTTIDCNFTIYSSARYSRTIEKVENRRCKLVNGGARAKLILE